MSNNLDDVAAAADAAADEQRKVARAARAMQRARDRGEPWSAILDRGRMASVVDTLRASAHALRVASTTLMTVLAVGLAAEGKSRRHIAERLGVSHQRVTSMLRPNGPASASGE